jgi:hypothetical protein
MRDHGLDEDTAFVIAEADDTLDRHVIVSPVVMLDAVLDPDDTDNRALMRRGRLLGHLPLDDHEPLGIAGMVVDLGYRATVDRLSLDRRLVSLTDPARIRLRYALARMDSLRTPDIGHELDLALGTQPTLAEIAHALAVQDSSPLADRPDLIAAAAAAVISRRPDADADDILLWAEAQHAVTG